MLPSAHTHCPSACLSDNYIASVARQHSGRCTLQCILTFLCLCFLPDVLSTVVLLCPDRAGCYGVTNVEQEGQRVNVVCFIWNAAQEGIASIKVCSASRPSPPCLACSVGDGALQYFGLKGSVHSITLYMALATSVHAPTPSQPLPHSLHWCTHVHDGSAHPVWCGSAVTVLFHH